MENQMQEQWSLMVSGGDGALESVSADVARLPIAFVNAYLVGEQGGQWALVDTGLPKSAGRVRHAAEERFGAGARPETIILTHGHFDHAGSAWELATDWDVPIFAHPLEMPYLTGRSDYPPQDPTVGGAIAFLSRFFPHHGYDFRDRVRELPGDGSVPGMPAWRWIHTPGHTPGQVSLFRDADRTLLAGDALTTVDLDSWTSQLTYEQEVSRPPTPFTPDWQQARRSVETLVDLEPRTIAAGHGVPMTGTEVPERLRRFAARFSPPPHGRYVGNPVEADERGVVSVPPPVSDPLPKLLAGAALGVLLGRSTARRRR